jgi:hypothetical protein
MAVIRCDVPTDGDPLQALVGALNIRAAQATPSNSWA